MDNSSSSAGSVLDQVAVGLSGLCLAHCLLLPVVLAVSPLLNEFSADHLHLQMLVVVLPVSIAALTLGHRKHRNAVVVAWGSVGMAILVIGATIVHQHFGLVADRLFTIAGALTLAVVHYFNYRLARICAD
jgi:hypothetical protein